MPGGHTVGVSPCRVSVVLDHLNREFENLISEEPEVPTLPNLPLALNLQLASKTPNMTLCTANNAKRGELIWSPPNKALQRLQFFFCLGGFTLPWGGYCSNVRNCLMINLSYTPNRYADSLPQLDVSQLLARLLWAPGGPSDGKEGKS